MTTEYKPTKHQLLAKYKVKQYLERHNELTIERLQLADMCAILKSRTIEKWFQQEGFAEWFYEQDIVGHKIAACEEIAIENLYKILIDDTIEPKDRLKALAMTFELANRYPKKTSEVKFLDKNIDKMDEQQVAQELENVKKKLALAT